MKFATIDPIKLLNEARMNPLVPVSFVIVKGVHERLLVLKMHLYII